MKHCILFIFLFLFSNSYAQELQGSENEPFYSKVNRDDYTLNSASSGVNYDQLYNQIKLLRFEPAMKDNKPIDAIYLINVYFFLVEGD